MTNGHLSALNDTICHSATFATNIYILPLSLSELYGPDNIFQRFRSWQFSIVELFIFIGLTSSSDSIPRNYETKLIMYGFVSLNAAFCIKSDYLMFVQLFL